MSSLTEASAMTSELAWAEPIGVEVIVGSVRPGRFGPVVADWFVRHAGARADLAVQTLDLADNLPAGGLLAGLGGVLAQVLQVDPLQGAGVGCLQHNLRGTPSGQRLRPARRAQAPLVPRPQPGEAVLRPRGGQVVAHLVAELEELPGHPHADGVHAGVLPAGVAAAVAVEPGERIGTAGLQLTTEHIARHGHPPPRNSPEPERPAPTSLARPVRAFLEGDAEQRVHRVADQ